MKIKDIQEACPLFARNYSERLLIYLFGSTARRNEMTIELDEVFGGDIDLLILVPRKTFLAFQKECWYCGVNFTNGKAINPTDYFWVYHTPKTIRLSTAFQALQIDERTQDQILRAFQDQKLDILVLPFGWEEDPDILEALNSDDPFFSKNMMRDAKVLFQN